ncbi:glutamyl-tRNA(Gln) amidotransferase subunit A-like [Pyrus ussuriensis x Pyrus communis]|uniref:Glutamyl-tRNA(Gln) amidotransferase subunit A-like n=1 Tax=Pyrus ussuriensis x Pyrus communis TaxID=2448454 RepID=A0A5N5G5H1_9ROSA|nr:glutamyl-tRNA(Gln) amidotransferase subunit A-like [Pyrus ussuriensis x Pyrus communis]
MIILFILCLKKKKKNESLEKISDISSIRRVFELFDSNFFNDEKMLEIVKCAKKFNIPTIRANRKLVGSVNGGLQDPSALIFPLSTKFNYPSLSGIYRPKNDDDIAFMTISLTFHSCCYEIDIYQVLKLGELIKSKQITSVELTRIFIQRLKRYNPILEAVVTYTEELANQQAKGADKLLARGVYLCPLHGIPYGLKDIISVPHYKTTWGSTTFKDQVLNTETWFFAKLVTGLLAYDDIWFGGRTRNPWNIKEFTIGSSSGPAACTSAGMVSFAIGSETVGSMTLPASCCGVAALHLTFGFVGRTGIISLSKSLDPNDLSSRDILLEDHFLVDITKLTVRYVDDAEMEVVHVLESKGVNMVPFKLNYIVDSVQGIVNFTMDVDMLAHFDEWQRSRKDDDCESQSQWPPELHRARIFPAVDHVQVFLIDSFSVDAFIGDATDWERVCMGNLVGMPVIVALALAMAHQPVTDHHKK